MLLEQEGANSNGILVYSNDKWVYVLLGWRYFLFLLEAYRPKWEAIFRTKKIVDLLVVESSWLLLQVTSPLAVETS